MSYTHSETFANLKSLKESITGNLTSYQYLSVLDELLYRAIYPLLENTQFVELFMSQMLGWQTLNPKRKASGLGRHAFSSNVTLIILCSNPKQKMKVLKRMRLDRSMLFEVLRRWFKLAEAIETLGVEMPTPDVLLAFSDVERRCCVRPGYSLTSTYRVSRHWFDQALDFKRQILEKYVRLCLVTAQRDYKDLNHRVPLNDIVQVYLVTASKAIDKCDSEKGVLTSHVQNWLLSAKNVVVSTYLTGSGDDFKSMSMSTTTNKRLVDSVSEANSSDEDMEELSHSDEDVHDKQQNLLQIRKVAKAFDPSGLGRISLGIEEELSASDLQALRALAVTELDLSKTHL